MVQKDEHKLLSLLLFALNRNSVSEASYFVGKSGEEFKHDDKLCLLKDNDGKWHTLYIERGNADERIEYSSLREAMKVFYWKLLRKDTPWDCRKEWEDHSGLEF